MPPQVYVPPLDWPPGALRPVINYGNFPRYVGKERRVPAYYPTALLPNATQNLIGHLPQVNHTYGYYEGDYAISNEHGLSFGESTCSARTYAAPLSDGGPALLTMNELSRLAAERTTTARAAVELMGTLARQYGFVGEGAIVGGESLLVADPIEQWIFHVLAESNATGGAIWAAQRVPRDHAVVVANGISASTNALAPGDEFLFSDNMRAVAKANGWWDGAEPFHFTRAFSIGEYTSHGYAARRMWAFWEVVAPSAKVPAEYTRYLDVIGGAYPTTARPDTNVTRDDVLRRVYRNYYQGTKYDLSAGPAAGPFSTPYRSKPGPGEAAVAGTCGGSPCSRWERSIASFRSTNIHVTFVRAEGDATLWFAPYAALPSVFVPILTSAASVPRALADAANVRIDRTKAYWAFKELAQYVYPRWSLVRDRVAEVAAELEEKGDLLAANLLKQEERWSNARANAADAHAGAVVTVWQELYEELLMKFADGYAYDGHDTTYLGYPAWWLTEVGYLNGTAQPCDTPTGTC